jgi:hypothetical protein
MGLEALLHTLERQGADTSDTPCNGEGYQSKCAPPLACTPDTSDTPQNDNPSRKRNGATVEPTLDHDALRDPAQERRRQAVLQRLREHPDVARAFETEEDSEGNMRVALAVRGKGTCELVIAADRWDPIKFLELMGQHGGVA